MENFENKYQVVYLTHAPEFPPQTYIKHTEHIMPLLNFSIYSKTSVPHYKQMTAQCNK